MNTISLALLMLAVPAFGQYKAEPAGAPPSELDPAIAATLQKQGVKILKGDKVVSEIWFRQSLPSGPKTAEDAVTFGSIPHGSLMGAIRFPANGSDRRDQTIKAGVYTMRFSMFPQNGDHQGVAPQRDFLLLTPATDDKDPGATPNFDTLVAWSRKASGTPHPAVFSIWKGDAGAQPGLVLQGEHDWVLQTKIGDIPLAMIVIGASEH